MPHSRGTLKGTSSPDGTGEFTIRRARPSDIPQMCGLLAELFAIEADFGQDAGKQKQGLGMLLKARNSAILLVAEKGGEVLGMCSIQTLISTAEGGRVGLLEDLIVRSDLRGAGIGTALLSEAVRWCALRDIPRIQLLRDIENSAALDFYKKRGWSGTRLVCMRRRL